MRPPGADRTAAHITVRTRSRVFGLGDGKARSGSAPPTPALPARPDPPPPSPTSASPALYDSAKGPQP